MDCKFPIHVRRKRIQIDFNEVSKIPFRRCTNIQSMAAAMNVAKSTLHGRIKEGAIRPNSNALKPYLSTKNKKARLQFCLSMLEPNSLNNNPIFKSMFNYVHIVEKWFFMSRESEKYYLLLKNKSRYVLVKANSLLPK